MLGRAGAPFLAATVRAAYNPAARGELSRSMGGGEGGADLLTWADAGPVATQESWDGYRHDTGFSVSWGSHSLEDLNALSTESDRAKARGFIDRCAITVLAGLPMRELDEVGRIVPLSQPEKLMVASWSSPETWQPGARHPGRGKYLIKTGQRVGIPVELEFVADEAVLYNTDGGFLAGTS